MKNGCPYSVSHSKEWDQVFLAPFPLTVPQLRPQSPKQCQGGICFNGQVNAQRIRINSVFSCKNYAMLQKFKQKYGNFFYQMCPLPQTFPLKSLISISFKMPISSEGNSGVSLQWRQQTEQTLHSTTNARFPKFPPLHLPLLHSRNSNRCLAAKHATLGLSIELYFRSMFLLLSRSVDLFTKYARFQQR